MLESSLHSQLKAFYSQGGGSMESWVEGYLIDVVKDQELIEIQTGNFPALKSKLQVLLESYPVRVVLPIAYEKQLILRDCENNFISRRRSPKKGRVEHLFYDLVYIPRLAAHPNFTLEVLLTSEEEERLADGKGSWRRRGVRILDHKLVKILEQMHFPDLYAFQNLIPGRLDAEFSNQELAQGLDIPLRLASKMTYCLERMGVLERAGKRGRAYLYSRALL